LGAASVLAQLGYKVTVFDKQPRLGGMMNLIPDFRLDRDAMRTDLEFVKGLGAIEVKLGKTVAKPEALLRSNRAVVVSAGLEEPLRLGIPGEEFTLSWNEYLANQKRVTVSGKRVAILGGGAVAVDCAVTAMKRGATSVELVYRRRLKDMPLTAFERDSLLEHGVEISTCSKVLAIVHNGPRLQGLRLRRLVLPQGKEPKPENFVESQADSELFRAFDVVISAIGSRSRIPLTKIKGIFYAIPRRDELPRVPIPTRQKGVFYAGDMVLGSSTVVESVASGKNAALAADAFIRGAKRPEIKNAAKSRVILAGVNLRPVPLDTDFFGRKLRSPFLLSAAPHTDGYNQMRAAYQRGWSGGVMKTSFDNVPIHIPSEYMTVLGPSTYGNCDNVSAHSLDRACREVGRLVKEFPNRLTLASTGGPVTGRDEEDKAVWQSNTRKLEQAEAMGVEYSLSCPQGGDGMDGDVVSQNAELTAKIIDWVMEASSDDIPKLFKLTAAVTAIQPILKAIKKVFDKYPRKQAGVTLANSFPALAFRERGNGASHQWLENAGEQIHLSPGERQVYRRLYERTGAHDWDEGVVVGMSGEGVLPISYLTLAKAAGLGVTISGNGGAMDYKAAANFLALGARTVQFCTIVMKYGPGIVDELHSGLSFLLEERGLNSVSELIGSALPSPIADFNSLSATKKLPQVEADLCQHCGNCTRCPYQAIALNGQRVPTFDAALCVGCSLCAQKCFAGAISMRARTPKESSVLPRTEAHHEP
jgi:dihydroorotate dehydrogenase/thioredoxin reductase/Pyruvate/2-oxoacid:ferredoxin oxidoreductase delta subunit